jgi:hypothetical protein
MSVSAVSRFSFVFSWLIVYSTTVVAAEKTAPTVAEALKIFDPAKVPLLKDAEPTRLLVGGFTYQAAGTPQAAFRDYQKILGQWKWKELPDSYVSEMTCSGTFSQADYLLSVSIFPAGKADKVMVSLHNHSNLNLKKLPVPKGAKPLYSIPLSEALVTEQPREAAAAEVSKLLRVQHWEPYGSAGDVLFFKQQAVRLSAHVAIAPAQGNKTVITYSAEQMSADLPAPAEAIGLQYADSTTNLMFDVASDEVTMVKFYNEVLGKQGWKPTLDKPILIGLLDTVIYRNPAKELLELGMQSVDDKLRVSLIYRSAAEEAELEAGAQAAIEAKKNAAKNAPQLGQLAIELPDEAKNLKATKKKIEFNLADGKSKPYAESLLKTLKAAGWKDKSTKLEKQYGLVLLENGERDLTISYVETGVIPAEFTISAHGVELEQAKKK